MWPDADALVQGSVCFRIGCALRFKAAFNAAAILLAGNGQLPFKRDTLLWFENGATCTLGCANSRVLIVFHIGDIRMSGR